MDRVTQIDRLAPITAFATPMTISTLALLCKGLDDMNGSESLFRTLLVSALRQSWHSVGLFQY